MTLWNRPISSNHIIPTTLTLNNLLQLCTNSKSLNQLQQIHQQLTLTGSHHHPFFVTKLIQLYADRDDLSSVYKLFDKLPQPNVFSYTAIFGFYLRHGMYQECLRSYGFMRFRGVLPDNYVFPKVLRACSLLQCLKEGVLVHKDVIVCGFGINVLVCNSLIDMYGKCGDVANAWRVFDGMVEKDLLTWNSLIAGYVSNGLFDRAVMLCEYLRLDGFEADVVTLNTLLDGYCRKGLCDEAMNVFRMIDEPNIISWTILISGYSRIGEHETSLCIFKDMVNGDKIFPDMRSLSSVIASCRHLSAVMIGKELHAYGIKKHTGTAFYHSAGAALLTMYAKSGRRQYALNVFDLMDKTDTVTWNAMIYGFIELELEHLAVQCFGEMQRLGIKNNETTISTVLPVCDLKSGRQIHAYARTSNHLAVTPVWNALIHMYCKTGCIRSAYGVFSNMVGKDIVTWNTMIRGLGMHGLGHDALQLLQRMNQSGVCPNSTTFNSVLSACNHSGLVDEGLELFNTMTKDYGFSPRMEHYSCVVDMLARSDHIEDAIRFIERMPIEPDKTLWGALLAACRDHQKIDIGKLAAEQLIRLEPERAGHYVTLSNIYAREGRWDDAERVRKEMEGRELVKPSGKMDATLVNWETLDSLVIEFAKSENLFEDDSSTASCSSPSVSSSSYRLRLIIRHITRSLEAGQIDVAIHLLQSHAPFILDDHTLLFRLQKQKFIELLRKGSEEDRNCAIDCARTALAPCALHAYPEAYEEFKHVLLAFIYNEDDQTSPVANEWSEQRRLDIAGLMSSVLRAHLHAYDPIFSMTLRYLISIHKAFCFRQGISSPVSDLYERLLLEERDPPVVPLESFYEAPPFDEVDIQALAHAVEITRQGAVDSLKFAKGDLFQAFQNELCRMRLDVSVLHDLVREYCVYRGIVDSGPVSPSALQIHSRLPRVDQQETISSSGKSSLECDPGVSKFADVETSISNTQMDVSCVNNVAVNITQAVDVELRYSGDSASNCEDCSTSGSHQPGNSKVIQKSRKYVTGERSKRKRWRGRQDEEDYMTGVSVNRCSRQDFSSSTTSTTSTSKQQGSDRHFPIDTSQKEDKYEFMLGMKELASKGMAADVVNEVNAYDSNFFVENPVLLFQLKQVEFLKLVNSGDHSSALKVACSHLGPIAARDPALLKPLKETLLALLCPNEEALGKCLSLHTLANSIQVAIGRRLGIEEPQLMKIMRATLHTHNEWFKLQMCKDRFESLLRIDSLKDVDTPLLSARSMSKSNADSCTQGSSQVTVSSGARVSEDSGSPTQASSGDVPCDENAILKVMEFLALPRADAIHLLAQYNGNAETVIQHIFA